MAGMKVGKTSKSMHVCIQYVPGSSFPKETLWYEARTRYEARKHDTELNTHTAKSSNLAKLKKSPT